MALIDPDPGGGEQNRLAQRDRAGCKPEITVTADRQAITTTIDPEPSGQQTRACRDPFRLIRQCHSTQQHAIGPFRAIGHHIHAVVDAIADIHINPPSLTKQRFVLR